MAERSSYPLRMTETLRKWVEERAKKEDRSLNTEIVRILRQAKEREEQATPDTK